MIYDAILVDVFNLYYRRKKYALDSSVVSQANSMIDFIEREVKTHQVKGKPFYLLFDPIPKNDLGLDSSFRFKPERKEILNDYKSNRKKNPGVLQVVSAVRKYYSHRGDEVVEVISNQYEADDFVESLVADLGDKASIAMVTTDMDWARFLSDKVCMINEGFDQPFTNKDFFEKYQFVPTIASVSVFKALFGDPSDNISGALMTKKLKGARDAKVKAFDYIKLLGETKIELDVAMKHAEGFTFKELCEKENRNVEEEFFYEILSTDPKFSVQSTMETNLAVIKTRCDSYKKYAVTKPVDEKFNALISKSLGIPVPGEKKKFRFGNIKS